MNLRKQIHEEKKGKGFMKKGLVIGIVCGVLALGLGAIGVSAAVILNNPTVRVTQGVTKLFKESATETDLTGSTALINENYKSVFEMDIYDLEGLDNMSFGLDATVLCDYDNQKMKENIDFSLSYYNFLSFQLAADKTDVYLDIPLLYDGSICFDSQNINEQFNNSIFKDMLESGTLDEELSMNFFEKAASKTTSFYDENKNEIMQAIKNGGVTKTGTVLPVAIGDKTVNCEEFSLSLKKDDINALLQGMYEQAGVLEENTYFVNDDIEILIYMDKKNNIKQIQTDEDMYVDELECAVAAVLKFTGKDNALDEVRGEFDVKAGDEQAGCDFEYSSVTEGKDTTRKMLITIDDNGTEIMSIGVEAGANSADQSFDMDIVLDVAGESLKVDMAGSVEMDNKSYAMKFQDCGFYYQDTKLGSFEGSYRVVPLEEEIVIAPTKTYPIFEFTEEEFSTFVMECYENIENYANMLEGVEDLF